MNKIFYMAFAILLFMACKTKKHLQLEETKSKSSLHIDSNYIDSITGEISSFTSTVINFDTLGKPTSITINKAVRESKKEVKQGKVIKDASASVEEIKKDEMIDKDGSKLFSINYLGLIPVLIIVALIIYSRKRK